MKVAAHVLAYNVNRYINEMLANVAPHVDRIYLAYSKRPFAYIPKSRQTLINPTELSQINVSRFGNKLKVIHGDWQWEEDARNACFDEAKSEGHDWLIIQDADEFYPEAEWQKIKKEFLKYKDYDHLATTWYNFWKSSEFALVERDGSIKGKNAGFAVRCRKDLKFIRQRLTNATRTRVIDTPCFHYGWVQTNQEVQEKIKTWSHAHQFDGMLWYRTKWLGWSERTKNLHPIRPRDWTRAVRFPREQPNFSDQFQLRFDHYEPSLRDRISEAAWDLRAHASDGVERLKSILRY